MPLEPSRNLVLKKLRDGFPDPAAADEAPAIPDTYGAGSCHGERDPVHLALLKISEGDLEKLRLYTRGALSDDRDTLIPAEYPEQYQASSKPLPPKWPRSKNATASSAKRGCGPTGHEPNEPHFQTP